MSEKSWRENEVKKPLIPEVGDPTEEAPAVRTVAADRAANTGAAEVAARPQPAVTRLAPSTLCPRCKDRDGVDVIALVAYGDVRQCSKCGLQFRVRK